MEVLIPITIGVILGQAMSKAMDHVWNRSRVEVSRDKLNQAWAVYAWAQGDIVWSKRFYDKDDITESELKLNILLAKEEGLEQAKKLARQTKVIKEAEKRFLKSLGRKDW